MNKEILDNIVENPKFIFAGFGRRFIAYLIDILPIIFLLNIFSAFVLGFNPLDSDGRTIEFDGQVFEESTFTRVIVRYVSFLIWITYCAIFEASSYQGTFGKRMIGLKVVDAKGEKLTIGKSIVRNLTKTISYVCIGLGFFWVLFNKQKRGWHDMVAKTFVTIEE